MRNVLRVTVLLVILAVAGVACAVALGGSVPPKPHPTNPVLLPPTTTVIETVTGPAGQPGEPGAVGATGATGATGAEGPQGVGADLCPNWDGIQSKPPKGTVGTLNPRGQFVCVKLAQAQAWHPKGSG